MSKRKLDEFRGFFFADGSCTLHNRRMKRNYTSIKTGIKADSYNSLYTVRICVMQRIDNLPLLKELRKEFGGYIWLRRVVKKHNLSGSKLCAQWQVQSVPGCHKLFKALLDTQFTYRSIDAVRACYEYCDWKLKRGLQVKLKPEDRVKIQKWIDRAKKAHDFNSYKGS